MPTEPRSRDERDKQAAREELTGEYAFLLSVKADPVLLPLIERLRKDLAEAIHNLQ